MKYECKFDFTVCKPKNSQFIGKSGVIELETDNPLGDEDLDVLKTDDKLLKNIAIHLNQSLNQKNIFSVTVKSILPKDN